MLSLPPSIGQLNKPKLTNDNCETVHTKWSGNGPLCYYTSIEGSKKVENQLCLVYWKYLSRHCVYKKMHVNLNNNYELKLCIIQN